jgi:hypothetical protein
MLYSDMLHLRCLLSAEPGHAGKRESRQSDERQLNPTGGVAGD